MNTFKRGHIWLVNFDPSFGHEYKKVRPALIVENDSYIETGNLLTVIPISSKLNNNSDLDIFLKNDPENRLISDSLIKTKQISSFDKRRFIKLIGIVNKEVLKEVNKNIYLFLL